MTKDERRELMPEVTKFIDEMRAAFGCDPAFIDATENGHRIVWGRRTEPDRSAALQPGDQ